MTTLRNVTVEAAKVGVDVEVQCDRPGYDSWGHWMAYTLMLDAPAGMVFSGTHTHSVLCVGGGPEGHGALSKENALKSALLDLSGGLVACDETNCDTCEENADD